MHSTRMDASRLKKIMEVENKRVIDIASELQIAPNTVAKFLRGENVSRVIEATIKRYLDDKTQVSGSAKAAIG